MDKVRYYVPATLKCLPEVLKYVQTFCQKHKLPESYRVLLAVEELLSNIIQHAEPTLHKSLEIYLDIWWENGQVLLEFVDTGPPFNPLSYEVHDLTASVENRKLGGLGIHLTKHNVDSLTYKRKEGCNHLLIGSIISREPLKKIM